MSIVPHRRGIRPESAEHDATLGRRAGSPGAIPWRGWKQVIRRTSREIISDRVTLVAAGCAFWATLSLFPAISMLISLYGIMFDPKTVEPQLDQVRDLLPPAAFALITQYVHTLVSHAGETLGFNLLISTGLALGTASTGTKSIISALNLAYEEDEQRSFLRFQAVGLFMTLVAIIGAALGIAILLFMPPVIDLLGLDAHSRGLIRFGSFAILVVFVNLSLSVLYRFGPCRRAARWLWITPGSLLGTALWVIASAGFSFYVGNLARYDAIYGPLGTVAAVMMWFWISALVVLLGAELNAELELQTAEDTTEGPPKPMGRRGAFVADNVARD
jgi:membrane protein